MHLFDALHSTKYQQRLCRTRLDEVAWVGKIHWVFLADVILYYDMAYFRTDMCDCLMVLKLTLLVDYHAKVRNLTREEQMEFWGVLSNKKRCSCIFARISNQVSKNSQGFKQQGWYNYWFFNDNLIRSHILFLYGLWFHLAMYFLVICCFFTLSKVTVDTLKVIE